MGTRPSTWVAATLLGLSLVTTAYADSKGDIKAKTKEAMENYDLLEFDAAKKLLDQALAIAKKGKLEKDPLTATIYLDIGITAHAADDIDGAKAAFGAAVAIDPKIQIPAAYKSPELTKLLEEARASAKPVGGGNGTSQPTADGSGTDAIDCEAVKGLQHTIVDTAPAGAALGIEALVGSDVSAVKVSVLYRVEGATDFTEVKMKKEGDCKYKGAIPASAMKGSLLHYYVGAFNDVNKPVAAKGSSGAPNLIEISGVASDGKSDNENPIGEKTDPNGGVVGGVIAGGKPPRVMISFVGGTGTAFLSGTTEGGYMVTDQGFMSWGNSLLVLTPELSYMVAKQLAVGIAVRIGLPIGANVAAEGAETNSTVAPGALLRLRYALSPSGEGVRVMGQVGGGVMRSTLSVTTDNMGDTDIVGQGPLLIGGGIGYFKYLSGKFAFVADVSALVGIAVVDKVGTTKVNSGFGADFSLGFALGF
ncbi:MAG: tetratricopeptide repeat protein [Kofleriaceae bacterium]|nr:tetratricopeptide repeat protein [Kofleriaceae bacterium]